MLKQHEKQIILSKFPNIKLSYENIIYKKVYNADYIAVIPKGIKCFAWFTMYEKKHVCFIMKLTDNKQISDIIMFNICLSNVLLNNTILYGTFLNTLNNWVFTIEDIFNYKGDDVKNSNWGEKLIIFNNLLKEIKQVVNKDYCIIFGLPFICKTVQEFEKNIDKLKYKFEKVQFHLFNKINNFLYLNYNTKKNNSNTTEKKALLMNERTFIVRPNIQNDIYYLYVLNNDLKEINCGIAHIPNYTTSVMMNNLFRIIKENKNLDALEESDDEEEFENENIDKFVKLNISYKMKCQYNNKFKKWLPKNIVNENSKVITLNEYTELIKAYENKNKKL
jgi:hypothetical protein